MTQELDREAEENGGAAHEPFETLRQAAKAVAAAAAVGAAVGAARAFTSRDSGEEDGDDEDEQREAQEAQAQLPDHEEEEEEDDEPEQAAEASQAEPDATAEQHEPEPETVPTAEHDEQEPEQEPEPEPEPEPDRKDRPETEAVADGSQPMQGGTVDETTEIVSRAREQLRALQGRDPESISSLERTDGGWTATFEVVELERIPSSMDVLASYQVALDEQKNMVRYTRTRRYHRAQSDREGGP